MTIETVKTIPSAVIADARNTLLAAGKAEIKAAGTAYLDRCAAIQRVIDSAKNTGVSLKQMLIDVKALMKECSLAKGEAPIKAAVDDSGKLILTKDGDVQDPGTQWKLSYSMGLAYVQSAGIAFQSGVPFSPSLYHAKMDSEKEKREVEKREKIAAAEKALSSAKGAETRALKQASKLRTKEAREKAAAAAEKVTQAQALLDDAVAGKTSAKTGGRKKKESDPGKPIVLTRHEITAHGASFMAMLTNFGAGKTAEKIFKILKADNFAK